MAILVLLSSCTDPIEIPTSKAMDTPASVLRNIVEEHDYKAKTRNTSGTPKDSIPVTEDNHYRTILANDISTINGLEFGKFHEIKETEYEYSTSTAMHFKDSIENLKNLEIDFIRDNLKLIVSFTAVQVNKIDDTHAEVYFEVNFQGRMVWCLLKCELNEFGIFNTESLSWCEQNGPEQNQKGYSYSKTLWLPDHAESYYLGTLAGKETSTTKAIINAEGTKYWKLGENSDDDTAFLHHSETQVAMQKAVLEWRGSKKK